MRYAVIYRRNDGTASLVGEPAEFPEVQLAQGRLDELRAGWQKLHHGDYEILSFSLEDRQKVLQTEKVAPFY